ncbi:PREDICTED: 3-oxoacyl-[acyl-carrier-protein] synthase II, chloroplastic-like [Populus euphratica]|uniref:beta-ketoacyl-[acyl-carrier-protein] synthase I n=1 Tax=Populus euphratica TaxID=75702 RepID=A0AAJ6T7U5_POPEU|nr:PREDICTED: 3-oxoacyl-[acyl-carrier-protein] synthase II, chloroplastic-like [Populus euphratica]XP_011006168.1 PREDICTED: 3-oxoacyl-[acyl-carrier-protein] synthase II, chloroplastic-like [Populus euphratica]
MTGSASLSSPLCTWLFTACMSVTCAEERAHALSPPSSNSSRRRKAKAAALPMKCCCSIRGIVHSSPSNDNSNNKSMLSFKGSMSSCLADNEPCSRYYASGGLLRRRLSPPATSGQAMAVAVQPTEEVVTKKKPLTRQRRVVVTGMGMVSPLGHDPGVFYNNLLQGVSGVTRIEAFDCAQFPTRIAGEIKSLSTDGWVAPKLSKRMDKFMLYMLTAGKKALADGGITEDVMDELNKKKCGVLIGSAMGGMKVFNDAIEALRISYKKMNPFCVPFATTNMGSAMLAMDLGWRGPNYSISTACATSNFCILNAANHIIRGEADVMLCGGSDAAIIPIGLGGFVACRALSQRNDDPTRASRPWNVNRDGFVMGEGAGVLLLEELEHAKKRGANIYAEFLGGSFTCDAYHMTQPRPDGIGVILCIEKALSQSGISKEDVNYINAHATSTPAGDLKEYQALMHCFGQNSGLRVNATKSMIGHLLGAAGAVEAIATIQAIRTGWVHPNINLENPDQGVDTSVLVGPKKERLDIKAALSNSFGFGGHNSSIIFAPFK